MRKASRMMLGLSGFLASFASGSITDFNLQNVLDGESGINGGSDPALTMTGVQQVVGLQGGQVAAIVQLGSDQAIVYKNTIGNSNTTVVAQAGSSFDGVTFGTVDTFNNLIIAGGDSNAKISFIGKAPEITPGNARPGVFQYTVGAPSPAKTVLFQGNDYPSVAGQPSDFFTVPLDKVPLQGNTNGQLLFGVKTPEATTTQYLVRSSDNGTTLETMIQDPGGIGYTEFNEINGGQAKRAITSDGAAVFMAKTSNVAPVDIIRVNTPGIGATVVVNGSTNFGLAGPKQYAVEDVLGASTQGVLFRATQTSGDTDHAIFINDGAANIKLADYDQAGATVVPTGQITPNGKAAFFVPGAGGADVLDFYNLSTHTLDTIVSVGEPLEAEGSWTITSLSPLGGSNPMVNERGEVVFSALVSDGVDDSLALLVWAPWMDDPTIIAKTGDHIFINGTDRVLTLVLPDTLDIAGDVLKDGLDDKGRFTFGATYDWPGHPDTGDTGTILFSVQVPEPGIATGLGALALAGLMRRRSRRR